MGAIRICIAGAGGGIVLGAICVAVVMSAVTAGKDGIGAGLAILAVSPLYLLLYIVAFFTTLLPAGLITGAVSGAVTAFMPRLPGAVLSALSGGTCGAFFGVRFADIMLEQGDTVTDLAVGGIAAALFLAAGGALLHGILRRSFKRS